jgi:hypothetical protein
VHADPLSNGTVCLRDAAVLQQLGVNTIRVYNVDPAADHDLCASIFNTAGIYMIIDVNSPQQSIDRSAPWTSYTEDYVTRIFGVVEAFKGYPNTMAFFAANEVMNDVPTGGSDPPYIRVSLQLLETVSFCMGLTSRNRRFNVISVNTLQRIPLAPFPLAIPQQMSVLFYKIPGITSNAIMATLLTTIPALSSLA